MNQPKHVNSPLLWSSMFIGAAIVVLAVMLPSLGNAVFGPTVDEPETVAQITKFLDQHEDRRQAYRDRFEGRSIFFKPKQPPKPYTPPPPPPPRPERNDEPEVEKPPPPKIEPKRPPYSGPQPQGILGEQVWFQGTEGRLSVGESDKGLTVISTNPPWSVTVEYRGWEYELPLFDRGALDSAFLEKPKPVRPLPGLVEVKPEPEPEPEPETPTKPEEAPEDEAPDDETDPDEDPGSAPPPRPETDDPRTPKPGEDPGADPEPGADSEGGDPEKDAEGESEKPEADEEEKPAGPAEPSGRSE